MEKKRREVELKDGKRYNVNTSTCNVHINQHVIDINVNVGTDIQVLYKYMYVQILYIYNFVHLLLSVYFVHLLHL